MDSTGKNIFFTEVFIGHRQTKRTNSNITNTIKNTAPTIMKAMAAVEIVPPPSVLLSVATSPAPLPPVSERFVLLGKIEWPPEL